MKETQYISSDFLAPRDAWDKLSIEEQAAMMKAAVSEGILDLGTIRQKYNEFAEGGNTVDDLVEALKKFMKRIEYEKPINTKITTKELSVTERISSIRNILKNKKRVNFVDLFTKRTKNYVVVTFLSILEMSKNKEIIIKKENNFNDIIIEGCEV